MFNQHQNRSINALNSSISYLNDSVENMNNMMTTGYKAKSTTFHETLNGLQAKTHRDFSSGAPKKTMRELDFAIDGLGFFEVQMPDGALAYTRDGSFQISSKGELVSSQGYPISNKLVADIGDINKSYDALNGENKGTFNLSVLSKKITVPTGESLRLGEDGGLTDSKGNALGNLRLVTFQNIEGLKDVGNGLFVPSNEAGSIEEISLGDRNGETQIKQGYRESTNISVVDNMARIVQTNTAIKTHLKVIKMLDQMQETINSTIARSV